LNGERCLPAEVRRAEAGTLNGFCEADPKLLAWKRMSDQRFPDYNSCEMSEAELQIRERLSKVYSEKTIEHIIRPHNIHSVADPDGYAECQSGCGENMKIWIVIKNDAVDTVGFWTDGCAATVACGSVCTDLLKHKRVTEAMAITARDIAASLGDLPDGNFHCAELAAQTAKLALKDYLAIRRQPWKKIYRKDS
jgi:nitrogen fixation NifU-like protein